MATRVRKPVMKAGIKGKMSRPTKAVPLPVEAAPVAESPPGTPDLPFKKGGRVKKC
jgi:hypothetical protein